MLLNIWLICLVISPWHMWNLHAKDMWLICRVKKNHDSCVCVLCEISSGELMNYYDGKDWFRPKLWSLETKDKRLNEKNSKHEEWIFFFFTGQVGVFHDIKCTSVDSALVFSLICTWTNGSANYRDVVFETPLCSLSCHCDVTMQGMKYCLSKCIYSLESSSPLIDNISLCIWKWILFSCIRSVCDVLYSDYLFDPKLQAISL